MTYRLVGLMSIVLLLSLAAFALLISHYQGQVMGELAHTASAIGRATLETLESHRGTVVDSQAGHAVIQAPAADVGTWVEGGDDAGGLGRREVVVFSTVQVPSGPGESVLIVHNPGEPPRRIPLGELSEEQLRELAPGLRVHRGDGPGGRRVEVEVEDLSVPPGGDTAAAGAGNVEDERRMVTVVRLDDIRTVEEPGKGLFLDIPAVSAEGSGDANAFQVAWTHEGAATGVGGPGFAFERNFRVEIPTDDYRDLFSRMRRRSGFVFLGVFLVGTVLSAAVATRFTRPVRRLDAAIHRLSEGNLDARVDVRGRDELARLGRAFNSMAHKLRVGRERAHDLARREKLSALGRLAAGVAHDVRNPLHSIGLTLQHLQEACAPESPARRQDFDRSLSIIRDEIHRLDKLVSSFLQFARSDRRERAPVSLAELSREVARLVEKEAERRGIEVAVETEGEIPLLPADSGSIRASILNLVLNAFDAMPEGGRVRLRVVASDGEVVVEVVDTGCGIPEAERDRVFDFSYTTREGGHGLGLAMVHHVVVEEHGGRVALDSAPGRGTRVALVFPRGVPEPAS